MDSNLVSGAPRAGSSRRPTCGRQLSPAEDGNGDQRRSHDTVCSGPVCAAGVSRDNPETAWQTVPVYDEPATGTQRARGRICVRVIHDGTARVASPFLSSAPDAEMRPHNGCGRRTNCIKRGSRSATQRAACHRAAWPSGHAASTKPSLRALVSFWFDRTRH